MSIGNTDIDSNPKILYEKRHLTFNESIGSPEVVTSGARELRRVLDLDIRKAMTPLFNDLPSQTVPS